MLNSKFCGVAAGEQLGNLEYLVDDRVLTEYRTLAGECASFANLVADDCGSVAVARFGDISLTAVWRRYEFLRPPVIGRRIQVGAWIKEVGEKENLPLLRVSAFAVDEIGTEILRSEAAFVVGTPESQPRPNATGQRDAASGGPECQRAGHVGDSFALGEWTSPSRERLRAHRQLVERLLKTAGSVGRQDDTALLAGWLEGEIGRRLGDDFSLGRAAIPGVSPRCQARRVGYGARGGDRGRRGSQWDPHGQADCKRVQQNR